MTAKPGAEQLLCPRCRSPIRRAQRFCGRCGEDLEASSREAAAPQSPARTTRPASLERLGGAFELSRAPPDWQTGAAELVRPPPLPDLGEPGTVRALCFDLGRRLLREERAREAASAFRRSEAEQGSEPAPWVVQWHLGAALAAAGDAGGGVARVSHRVR